jgi:hypothetical protein
MIGIRRHFGEPAFAQQLFGPDTNSIHRESCAFRDNTKTGWIRSYVLVAAELNEVEDVF